MNSLDALGRRDPEWAPWLGVLRVALDAAGDAAWDAMVPADRAVRADGAPILDGATLRVGVAPVDAYWRRLQQTFTGRAQCVQSRAVFHAALEADGRRLDALALAARAESDAFRALAGLLTLPFLQACGRARGDAVAIADDHGWCPLCGGWPAFAEVCGVDRARYLRCVRCGSAWPAQPLRCPYCGETDHDVLGSLVAERAMARSGIEVCGGCRAYVKVLNALQPGAPAQVPLDDLASVELDLAALDRGYARPRGLGAPLRIALA